MKLIPEERFYFLAVKDLIRPLGNCGACLPTNKENNGVKVSEQSIAKHKQTQEKNELSYQTITESLDLIKDSFYVVDHEFNFVYANKKTSDFVGSEPEDFFGKELLGYISKTC